MSDDDQPAMHDTFGLVMPFVACESNGGPFDDLAYVGGYEAGQIDALLAHDHPHNSAVPVHVENLDQLDLIAMRHGYTMQRGYPMRWVEDGWAFVNFTKTPSS